MSLQNPALTLDESIKCLNYLFEKLITTEQRVSLNLYGKAFIPKCKVQSAESAVNGYRYDIVADNGTHLTLNPEEIKLVRYDVISSVATTFEVFKTSLANAELQTGNYDFMVHFMIHDADRAGGFLLTIKILKSS